MRTPRPAPSTRRPSASCPATSRNGSVNVFDFNILKPNLTKTGMGVVAGDINGDNAVNIFDFNEFKPYLGKTTPA